MRLGIDFGTTRTVVAVRDRGNNPVVAFEGPEGDLVDHWPSVVASDGEQLLYGLDAAEHLDDDAWSGLRSLKRLLVGATPESAVTLAGREWPLMELLCGFLRSLRTALVERSSCPVPLDADTVLEVMVAVPAGASSAQRMATLDAFRASGFHVVGLINEPSAAGLEYADRYRKTLTSTREDVLVYDLGGGTFDVSLVRMGGGSHEVLAHAGDNHLGGSDFDALLLDLALAEVGRTAGSLSDDERTRHLERCRVAKEALNPNSRKVSVELGDEVVTVDAAAFYDAAAPLLERSLETVERVLPGLDAESLAGVYVVGGGSDLPVVARRLKDVFGRRVKRSAYASAATAVGLAIALDEEAPALAERFSRTFGVFRELDGGGDIAFDPILVPETEVDGGEAVRRYRAAHNIGLFRFAECDRLVDGAPVGDLLPWGVLSFPFDPALQTSDTAAPVERLRRPGSLIEERYKVDEAGIVEVRITDLGTGFSRSHRFAHAAAHLHQ